ncbi:SRPBCC family protein [Streptomyces sp900116325]|uniref:SRPBCC family protein n=1 Tax=Streptomyces sp. 900116325 TaxID=3154295 RepID=A0ABV2UJR2_9ACTN
MRAVTAVPLAALSVVLVVAASGVASGHSHDHSGKASYSRSLTCAGVHPDVTAPVITRKSIVINAPLDTIWKVQTDVENWPTWQPNVTSVVKDTPGALRSGSVFRWATEGLDITSTVKRVEHGKCLAWGGPAQGINAIHVWTFTPTKDRVLVHTEESWTGAPVVANTATLQAALDTSLQNWMNNLKHESESHS